jgi:sensor domain CHASE-containing protein
MLALRHCKSRLLGLQQAITLPLDVAVLLIVLLVVMAVAIWPARTERQRRLRQALMHGLAGED